MRVKPNSELARSPKMKTSQDESPSSFGGRHEEIAIHRRADRPHLAGGGSGQKTQAQVCRDNGVSQNTFYLWKRKYAGMETDDVRRLRELERENTQLKILLAERDLEISAVKKVFRKSALALPSELRERNG